MLAPKTRSRAFCWLALFIALGGCTSQSPPSGSAGNSGTLSGNSAASADTSQAFVTAQVQVINAPLNANPAYSITSADLGALGNEGILNAEDQALLNQLSQN